MRYADRDDVPAELLSALKDPYYTEGLKDHFQGLPDRYRANHFSVTTLIRSGRQVALGSRHGDKVLHDPLDGMWRLFGHVIHSIMENHGKAEDPDAMIELRVGHEIEGFYAHGQADLYLPGSYKIRDYKVTKAEAMLYDDKDEHVQQLNLLAALFRLNGHPVEELELVFVFRNHDPRKYVEGGRYPKEAVMVSPVPVWDYERAEQFLRDRVRLHIEASKTKDEDLAECTDKERWQGPPLYKVYKLNPDGSRQMKAKATVETKLGAEDWLDAHLEELEAAHNEREAKRIAKLVKAQDPKPFERPEFEIVELPGKPIKCFFCEIADFCSQRQVEIEAEKDSQDDQEKPESYN